MPNEIVLPAHPHAIFDVKSKLSSYWLKEIADEVVDPYGNDFVIYIGDKIFPLLDSMKKGGGYIITRDKIVDCDFSKGIFNTGESTYHTVSNFGRLTDQYKNSKRISTGISHTIRATSDNLAKHKDTNYNVDFVFTDVRDAGSIIRALQLRTSLYTDRYTTSSRIRIDPETLSIVFEKKM